MSRRLLSAALAGALCASTPAAASARVQSDSISAAARAALDARIDSLAAEYRHYSRLVHVRDSVRAAGAKQLDADTVVIGPFLFVNREPPSSAAVAALRNAWAGQSATVGEAVTRLQGTIISRNLGPRELAAGDVLPVVHPYSVRDRAGAPDFAGGAGYAVGRAMAAAMPEDVRHWLGTESLYMEDAFVWAYRDLATSGSIAARRCFVRDIQACVLALTGDASPAMSSPTRLSLIQHALELGGDGSYARLIDGAPGVATALERAAKQSVESVVGSWRDAAEDARPRVHAGVARAGFWTVVWLLGLALFAMRSTRWRLG